MNLLSPARNLLGKTNTRVPTVPFIHAVLVLVYPIEMRVSPLGAGGAERGRSQVVCVSWRAGDMCGQRNPGTAWCDVV